MAKAKSKKRATAASRTARKSVAALVKAGEAKRKGKARATAEEASKEAANGGAEDNATPGKQRWKGLSIEQLQELYTQTLGRPSGSNDRAYLVWKIREAEKGNVPVGPVTRAIFEGPTSAVTLKLEDAFIEELDAAAKDDGFKSRLGYLRDLIRKGLEVRGRSELAAKVAG